MNEELIKKIADAFLRWPLPKSVRADLCASEPGYPHRRGTNLLTYPEAEQMVREVVMPLIAPTPPPQQPGQEGANLSEAEQMIAWMGDPNAKEDRFDEIMKFWREGDGLPEFKDAVALAMRDTGCPLVRPAPSPTAGMSGGEPTLGDIAMKIDFAALDSRLPEEHRAALQRYTDMIRDEDARLQQALQRAERERATLRGRLDFYEQYGDDVMGAVADAVSDLSDSEEWDELCAKTVIENAVNRVAGNLRASLTAANERIAELEKRLEDKQ